MNDFVLHTELTTEPVLVRIVDDVLEEAYKIEYTLQTGSSLHENAGRENAEIYFNKIKGRGLSINGCMYTSGEIEHARDLGANIPDSLTASTPAIILIRKGATGLSRDIITHELAHLAYKHSDSYRSTVSNVYSSLSDGDAHFVQANLDSLGYDKSVYEDEWHAYAIQAYFGCKEEREQYRYCDFYYENRKELLRAFINAAGREVIKFIISNFK